MLSVLLGFSKYYVDSLSENVKRGNRTKLEMGWRPNRAPAGYRNDYATKTILPDGEAFETIKRLFELAMTGQYSVPRLANVLSGDWGYRTPVRKRVGGRPLSVSMVYLMLSNPFYAGFIKWNDQIYPGKQVPMLSWDDFIRLQVILKRKGREKSKRHVFAYTGLIRCGSCGRMVTAENKVNRYGSHYAYYHCSRTNTRPVCRQPVIEVKNLETQIGRVVENVTFNEKIYERAKAFVTKLRTKEAFAITENRKSLDRAIGLVETKIRTLTDLRLSGVIDDTEFINRRTELQQESQSLRNQRDKLAEVTKRIEPLETLNLACNRLVSWYAAGNSHVRRRIFQMIGSNPILKDKILSIELVFPVLSRSKSNHFLIWSAWLDDVRTRLAQNDEKVRTLVTHAEALIRLARETGLLPPDSSSLKEAVREAIH